MPKIWIGIHSLACPLKPRPCVLTVRVLGQELVTAPSSPSRCPTGGNVPATGVWPWHILCVSLPCLSHVFYF